MPDGSTGAFGFAGASFYHVGVFVTDLEEAIATYSRAMGLTFTEPLSLHIPAVEEAGSSAPVDVRIAFSREAPPYYELIEKTGSGYYGREQPDGLHHLGIWVADVEAGLQAGAALAMEREAVLRLEDGSPLVAFLRPAALHGVRLELVPEARRAGFEAWIAGTAEFG